MKVKVIFPRAYRCAERGVKVKSDASTLTHVLRSTISNFLLLCAQSLKVQLEFFFSLQFSTGQRHLLLHPLAHVKERQS